MFTESLSGIFSSLSLNDGFLTKLPIKVVVAFVKPKLEAFDKLFVSCTNSNWSASIEPSAETESLYPGAVPTSMFPDVELVAEIEVIVLNIFKPIQFDLFHHHYFFRNRITIKISSSYSKTIITFIFNWLKSNSCS